MDTDEWSKQMYKLIQGMRLRLPCLNRPQLRHACEMLTIMNNEVNQLVKLADRLFKEDDSGNQGTGKLNP